MEISYVIYIIIGILILSLIIFFSKKNNYSKESLDVLKYNFLNSDFSKINSIEDLKEKLELQTISNSKKMIQVITDDARHKIDILRNYREKNKLPFNEVSFLKVTANCVVDYAIKKELDEKEAIKILFLILESEKLEEIIGNDASKEFLVENFLNLLEGFDIRYKKRLME